MISRKLSNFLFNKISSNLKITDKDTLEELKYGIELIMINIVKLTLIFLICGLLGIFKYSIVALFSFGALRYFASGVHIKSPTVCFFVSLFFLLFNIYISVFFPIKNILLLLCITTISLINIIIYAPADTEYRPLINPLIRRKLKTLSIITNILLIIIIYIVYSKKLYMYSTLIAISALYESILILPITYKLLGRRYQNYEKYEEYL